MQTSAPDLTELKSRLKATWVAGDFGQIANFTAHEAALAAHLEQFYHEDNLSNDGETEVQANISRCARFAPSART